MGNSVLRERLKGPALAAYYPRNSVTIADIQKEFKRYDMETWNEEEEDRLEGLQIAKLRGKGAPKKKREANSTNIHPIMMRCVLTILQQARKGGRRSDQQAQPLGHNVHDTLYEKSLHQRYNFRHVQSASRIFCMFPYNYSHGILWRG